MSGKKRLSIVILGFAGVLSGILTLHPPLPQILVPDGGTYLGAIYGSFLAVWRWIFHCPRSIARSVTVVMSSTAAYIAAMFSTIWAYSATAPHESANPPSYVMSVGGAVGALIISTTILLLHRGPNTKLGKAILICTIGGSALGVFGYALGGWLANPERIGPGDMPGMASLFIVWQAGMGCLLSAVLPEPVLKATAESFGEVSILHTPAPAAEQEPARRVPVWGKILLGFLAVSLISWSAWSMWRQYNFHRQEDAFRVYRMSRPPLANLPTIEPVAAENVVLLHTIAGRTAQLLGPLTDRASGNKPESVNFTACYMHLANERCEANPPEVEVRVSQWPNSDWSGYEVEGIHYGLGVGYFNHARKIRKFGNTIMADASPKDSGKGKFYWTSGAVLVVINSNVSDSDEFMRQYLERYPSSLQ